MLAKALHKEVLVETFILVETQTLVSAASWGLVAPCLWPSMVGGIMEVTTRAASRMGCTVQSSTVAYSLKKVVMLIWLVWL